ncbi:hypothetical protein QE152_g19081 [Popillia japonica]|uniref:PiggyBac transposable element-derived protein domain-containing protein n=1 Tax=Popillia japonica TaxID=7064 RepID=A0AAW1KY85_POPJA
MNYQKFQKLYSDDSDSEFEWEGGNELPKIPKIISAGSINKDISNFTRQNVFELFLNEDILEDLIGETDFCNRQSRTEDNALLETSVILMEVREKDNLILIVHKQQKYIVINWLVCWSIKINGRK